MISQANWSEELTRRRSTIWDAVVTEACDLLLVYGPRHHPEPFRYLTNFVPVMGDAWGVMSGAELMGCFLNFHWELQEARNVSGLDDWQGEFDPFPLVLERIRQTNTSRIAVLGLESLPWHVHQNLLADIPNVQLVDIGSYFARLRRIKSPLEIKLIKKAAGITDKTLTGIRERLSPGMTEAEIAAQVVYDFFRDNAGAAFSPMVMAGLDEETAVIARSTRTRPIQRGDTVMIDIGAAYGGYQADVSRTMVLGQPSALQQRVWDVILEAYDMVVSMAKPGIPCNHLDQAARKIYRAAGYELKHRIGHGVGLATSFEWPSLDTETALLQPGMTFAIEPGIYELGVGAMKLEDMLVITESGVEVISHTPRDIRLAC